jgi:D-alanyl-lipoteichoic acid acyltransferase DltB (MBOAT superfamily)
MALRGGALFGGALAPIWPLLGAFFMFRLVLYAHDIEHEKGKPSFVRALAYFFMLPNVFFPLFPVVDWKAFGRSYYNDDAMRIYQRGLHWMARGVLQIVFYRIVYYHFYVDASLIEDGSSLLRHLLANFALYLRVSGQFHMIVGLLLLFGFNLPETNHHYFLAESFTDYWRR